MTGKEKTALFFGSLAAALYWLSQKGASIPGLALSQWETRDLIARVAAENGFQVDLELAAAIVEVESSFNPTAIRLEPWVGHVGGPDTSAGLFQTLHSTAIWLATSMGRDKYGEPDLKDLFDPEISTYFGLAYLDWLSRYRGLARSTQWIARAYNGGPGWSGSATAGYWQKVQRAMEA